MKKYYDRNTAPLKFHTFVRYVSLPIGALYLIYQFISYLPAVSYNFSLFPFLTLIDVLYMLAAFALCVAAFIGFFKWASYSWTCYMAFIWTNNAYNLYVVILYAVYGLSVTDVLSRFLGSLLAISLMTVYYVKRKPLFFGGTGVGAGAPAGPVGAVPAYGQPAPPPDPGRYEAVSFDPPQANFCRYCGNVMPSGSRFCRSCGASADDPAGR